MQRLEVSGAVRPKIGVVRRQTVKHVFPAPPVCLTCPNHFILLDLTPLNYRKECTNFEAHYAVLIHSPVTSSH